MISAFNQHKPLRLRQRREQSLQLRPRTKLIAPTTDKQLRLNAVAQETKCIRARCFRVGGDRNRRDANANHSLHPRIWTGRTQSNCSAEGEAGKHEWKVKLRIQPVESGPHVFDFPVAVIVFALAES